MSLWPSVSMCVEWLGHIIPASLPAWLLWSLCDWPLSLTTACPAQRFGAHRALQLSHHATKNLCFQTEGTGCPPPKDACNLLPQKCALLWGDWVPQLFCPCLCSLFPSPGGFLTLLTYLLLQEALPVVSSQLPSLLSFFSASLAPGL